MDSRFPGTDYALVQYDSTGTDQPGAVDLCNGSTQEVTHAADARASGTGRAAPVPRKGGGSCHTANG